MHKRRTSRCSIWFRKGRRTRAQIVYIIWIIEKAREFQKNIYLCFIDYAKSLCVHHNKLWKILKEMGIPDQLTCFLRNLYAGQETAVRTGHGTTVNFSHSVMSESLRPHEPQHARPHCSSPTPGVHPNSCPLSQWWHPTISSSVVPFFSYPQSFLASESFKWISSLLRWPNYWSFSSKISLSNEHPGLISFRMDWLDLLAI